MRTLDELINRDDPGWPIVLDWLKNSANDWEILPVDRARGEQALVETQVTSHSPLGAIALETGGILMDRGWLRILGAGGDRMHCSLSNWNGLGAGPLNISPLHGVFVVAYDAAGGFFAINGGGIPGPQSNVFYHAPDSLEWEDLGRGYSDFLVFATSPGLAQFYESLRWPGWEDEIVGLSPDHGVSFYPFLFSREGSPTQSTRAPVPMEVLWGVLVNG